MAVIITYNINGIRAGIRKKLIEWVNVANPDILCLQEIKANPEQFDQHAFNKLGYYCFIHSADKPGYSGVAILSKKQPNHVEYGCGIKEIDVEGRVIRLDYDDFSVISVYFPSGSSGDIRQEFKMIFLNYFSNYINDIIKDYPNLIICGDYNICHESIDIHNPIANKNTSGFLPEERLWMTQFLEDGFVDTFRYLNKDPHQYSWWSYRANSRAKNLGWRIDYNLMTKSLLSRLHRAAILSEAKHSDHCPVLLEIED